MRAWPTWRSDVDGVQFSADFAVGSAFRWQTAGLDITSVISQVNPRSRTAWGGLDEATGITGIHVWTFTPTTGGVLVHTEESWSGKPIVADTPGMQAALDESLRAWLRDLRDEAARRAG